MFSVSMYFVFAELKKGASPTLNAWSVCTGSSFMVKKPGQANQELGKVS